MKAGEVAHLISASYFAAVRAKKLHMRETNLFSSPAHKFFSVQAQDLVFCTLVPFPQLCLFEEDEIRLSSNQKLANALPLAKQELAEAEMDVESRKRKLPKGTSKYQAAWILDEDFSSDEEIEEVDLQVRRIFEHRKGRRKPQKGQKLRG